jgi:hypothetical protein
MTIQGNISFRTHLLGRVEEFVTETDMQPLVTERTLAYIVTALANYTEEGKHLSPELYLTTDVDELMKFLPGSSRLEVGRCAISEETPNIALKHCAPLANRGWCIYVDTKDALARYGIFRDALTPLAIPIGRALLAKGSGDVRLVRIHQSAPGCVEMANHKGDSHIVFLSHKRESEPSPKQGISDLAEAICGQVRIKFRERTQTVIERTISAGLQESHGALVAVTRGDLRPKFVKDGRFFLEPLNFEHLVEQAIGGGEEDRLRLLSHASVLEGVFACDGIVIFNRRATVIGYNCFVSSAGVPGTATGGARQRAYAILKNKIGHGLFAAFIRSQDGASEFTKLS